MKKFFLFLCMLTVTVVVKSQTIQFIPGSNSIRFDTAGSGIPFVVRSSTGGSAAPDTTVRYIGWFEPGTGDFSNDPDIVHTYNGNKSHLPFLLATKLYDTTKDLVRPSKIIVQDIIVPNNTGGNNTYTSNQSNNRLSQKARIKIIPSASDIVPGDTMAFAIAYRTFNMDLPGKGGQPPPQPPFPYKLYFFYNNNPSFKPITSLVWNFPGGTLPVLRKHHATESALNKPALGNDVAYNTANFQDWACFTVSQNEDFEKTVFLSLIPKDTLEMGGSGSVYAVLVDAEGKKIGDDMIPSMRFAPAHDPNYLVQIPDCLEFPKAEHPFTYTVHFQNTGEGEADSVRVVVSLPKGMNLNSYHLTNASFAGNPYTLAPPIINQSANELTFIFSGRNLKGTDVANSASNPETMGEFIFTMKSTPNTDDNLAAFAKIYFHSVHPSAVALNNPGQYEYPVQTNTAVTKYVKDCNCKACTYPHCCIILGLCWWWWLIIVAVIIIVITWWLIARKKKKKEEVAC